jgi:2-polyprenyl-6-methoxyphenol hydroxylase-like FAD-dependent oxidoreductase
MSTSPIHVLIIGAGTGGLCLAHGLKRAGISVAVYERDRTRADGLQGFRVGIDPDGSRALHACLPPELFDTFVSTCARTPIYSNMLTEQLSEILSIGERSAIDPIMRDPINSEKSVSRMTLRQVLLTGLVTPGRGVGANTALRDAALLCRNLTAVRDGRMPLIQAIRDYETQMIDYGFDAVVQSRKQMDGNALIHKPIIGRAVLAAMRTAMRVVNRLPSVKRRMAEAEQRYRGADRKE